MPTLTLDKLTSPKADDPLQDFRALVENVPTSDSKSAQSVVEQLRNMGHERDFGVLGDAAEWLASWQNQYPPRISSPVLAIFSGAHGALAEGISFSNDDDTRTRLDALRNGTAPLSAIAAEVDAEIRVFELALSVPTGNIAVEPSMTPKECAATLAYGFEAVENQPDVLSLAVSGAGVGTIAAAAAAALYGGSPEYWVRSGPGTPTDASKNRAAFIAKALATHRGHCTDPLEILCRMGGRELTACVGAIIAARHQNVPVILDGFATTIAAGIVHAMNPEAVSHVMAAHVTHRPAHEAALERIGLTPLMQLGFQIGGGLGSTTAINLLKVACAPFIGEAQARGL